MMVRILLGIFLLVVVLVIGAAAATFYVQREADFHDETLARAGATKALILYHPSRDAGFSDDVSLALAEGFKEAGLAVDRQTMTARTPARPQGYAVAAVVTNTFFAAPDAPTIHYLQRADLKRIPVIGLICGAGSTDDAQRKLDQALRRAGADVLETRPYWIWRPNDEKRANEPNRAVARDMARKFGFETGRTLMMRQGSR